MGKLIELAKKLKALADRGVGGEKVNAEKFLSNFLKKHNISFEDIEDEKIEHYFFKIEPRYRNLLNQIIKKIDYSLNIYGEVDAKTIKAYKMKGNYFTECTASQFVLIDSMFNFYKSIYEEELDVFFTAFCTANKLLIEVPEEQQKTISDLTPEELQRYRKANHMAEVITKRRFHKQLN